MDKLEELENRIKALEEKRVSQADVIPDSIKMRAVGEGVRFIRDGLSTNRPTVGEEPLQGAALYFSNDNGVLSIWNGEQWIDGGASFLNSSSTISGGGYIQAGWGYMQGAASQLVATVTFDKPYASLPIVTAVWGGDNAASGAYGAGGNNVKGLATCKAEAITATTFDVRIRTTDGTSWGAGDFVFYQWTAIGLLA